MKNNLLFLSRRDGHGRAQSQPRDLAKPRPPVQLRRCPPEESYIKPCRRIGTGKNRTALNRRDATRDMAAVARSDLFRALGSQPPQKEGGQQVRFARRCACIGAVLSAGITLALVCEQLAGLLDKALMI